MRARPAPGRFEARRWYRNLPLLAASSAASTVGTHHRIVIIRHARFCRRRRSGWQRFFQLLEQRRFRPRRNVTLHDHVEEAIHDALHVRRIFRVSGEACEINARAGNAIARQRQTEVQALK